MKKEEEMQGFQMVRETIEESFSDNSSLNLEKLITDTFDNLRDDETSDPDIIASVAERLLDEAEIGEYDAKIPEGKVSNGRIEGKEKKNIELD